MKNINLDKLVERGSIDSYSYESINSEGKLGENGSRDTQRLIIYFNDSNYLTINTFCSGSAENTIMFFDAAIVQ